MRKLPSTPAAWAIHLTNMLTAYQTAHGLDRFPVDVASIAKEYSKQVFPKSPITLIEGIGMNDNLEGALLPNKNGEWGILFNIDIKSKGRQNFTLAHELGHYLLHRDLAPQGLNCKRSDMFDWDSEESKIENEANTFASYFLMPLDDFRLQVKNKSVTLKLMQDLAERYAVSISAAILKWLSFTEKRAMIVISNDGFIQWSRSSGPLFKSGIYYPAKQKIIELPSLSLAAKADESINNLDGLTHPKGVWNNQEQVQEMTIIAKDTTLSLLIYPDDPPFRYFGNQEDDEDGLQDTYSRFSSYPGSREK